MGRTFRPSPDFRNLGWLALVGFSSVSVFSGFVSLQFPAETRLQFLLLAEVVWLSMVGLSAWLLLVFYRETLCLDEMGISQQGVPGARRIVWNEVTSLVWGGRAQGDRAIVKSSSARLIIDFGNFTRAERLLLMQRLRAAVPEDIQTDWPLFCHRVALRLLERELKCEPRQGQMRIFRGDHDRWYLAGAAAAASFGAAAAWYVRNPFYGIGAPLAVVLPWLFLRFSIPREGLVVTKSSASYARIELRNLLVMWGALSIFAIMAIPAMRRFEHDPALTRFRDDALAVFMAGLCITVFGVALIYGRKLETRKTAEERARAPASEQRWLELIDKASATTQGLGT